MKTNNTQRHICDVIHSQCDFWRHTNDITSPTHICDIHEEIFSKLSDEINDSDAEEFGNILESLYWFIRKFDSEKE